MIYDMITILTAGVALGNEYSYDSRKATAAIYTAVETTGLIRLCVTQSAVRSDSELQAVSYGFFFRFKNGPFSPKAKSRILWNPKRSSFITKKYSYLVPGTYICYSDLFFMPIGSIVKMN